MDPQNNQDVDDEGLPNWEPITLYDAPGVLLKQMMDGETSLGRAYRTIMNSSSLSPKERDSFATKIKKDHGGNSLLDTTIDLALNPWVWLLIATGAASRGKITSVGGQFLGGRAEVAGKKAGKIIDLFRGMGVLGAGPGAEYKGTSDYLHQSTNLHEQASKAVAKIYGTTRGDLLKHLRHIDLDPTRIVGTDAASVAEREKLTAIGHYILVGRGKTQGSGNAAEVVSNKARVALVENDKTGVTKWQILPAEKGDLARKQLDKQGFVGHIGASVPIDTGGGVFATGTLKSTPIEVLNEEKYLEARKALGRDFSPQTDTVYLDGYERNGLIKNQFPISKAQMQSHLQSMGVDIRLVDRFAAKVAEEHKFWLNQTLGTTPQGLNTPTPMGLITSDPTKSKIIARELSRVKSKDSITRGESEAIGVDVGSPTYNVLPDWFIDSVRSGKISASHAEKVLASHQQVRINLEDYFPHGDKVVYKMEKGKMVASQPIDVVLPNKAQSAEQGSEVTGHVLARRNQQEVGLYNPEDLESFHRIFGSQMSPAQEAQMVRMKQASWDHLETAKGGNRQASFIAMAPEVTGRSYTRDMIAQWMQHATGNVTPEMQAQLAIDIKLHAVNPRSGPSKGKTPIAVSPNSPLRQRTMSLLGVSPADEAAHRFKDETFAVQLKYEPALVEVHGKISTLEAELATGPTGTRIKDIKKELKELEGEVTFISGYRRSFVNQKPETMEELRRIYASIENKATAEQLNGWVVPRFTGQATARDVHMMQVIQSTKDTAGKFANSAPGIWIRDNMGSAGRMLHRVADEHSKTPTYFQDGPNLVRDTAGYLYSTHLSGLMQAMNNGLQLFTWAGGELGLKRVMTAIPETLKQWSAYNKERMSLGAFSISPKQRDELLLKHIPGTNFNGTGVDTTGLLGGTFTSTLDNASPMSRVWEKPGKLKDIVVNWALTPFTKMEEFNRILLSNMGKNIYQEVAASGSVHTSEFVARQITDMQSRYNFAGDVASKPRILNDPNWGLGKVLGHSTFGSVLGQLFSYPIRFFTAGITAPQVFGGGTSDFGFQRIGGPSIQIPTQIASIARMTGISALIYEAGKNVFGLDLQGGLSAQSATGIARIFSPPPILDIPIQAFTALSSGDQEQLRRQIFRVVPYGNPLIKALGALPAIPGVGGPFGMLQSQYADWTNPDANGNIPVYKDDGTLQSLDSPLNLVMRGIGFDTKKFQSTQEASKFLIANRQEITGMKRQYKDAILGNNYSGATAIENEYKKRFGMGITVKNAEWDQAIKMREVGLSERLLDTLPSDVRSQYQQSLGSSLDARMGLQQGGLESGDTAKQREKLRAFSSGLTRPDQILLDEGGGG